MVGIAVRTKAYYDLRDYYTKPREQCYPEIIAIESQPEQFNPEAISGWNGGARSVAVRTGDVFASFTLPLTPIGVICGLAKGVFEPRFALATHAIYAHGTTIDIVESGVVVATAPYGPNTEPEIAITRRFGQVVYKVGDWYYRSEASSQGPIYLSAVLYTLGDSVDDPVFSALSDADVPPQLAVISGSLPGIECVMADVTDYVYLAGSLPVFVGDIEAEETQYNTLGGSMPALLGLVADSASYVALSGNLPALRGIVNGSEPEFAIAVVSGLMPAMQFSGVMLVHDLGIIDASLPAVTGLIADVPGYAAITGDLEAQFYSYIQDNPTPDRYGWMEYMLVMDGHKPELIVWGVIHEELGLATSMTLVLVYEGQIFESILVDGNFSLTALLRAVFTSGLAVNSNARKTVETALQYAVNLSTGAVTTYSGFNFNGFVNTDRASFAWKPDGLYRIEGDTDDGNPRSAMVDFGAIDPGSNLKQRMIDTFIGLSTDGEAYLKLWMGEEEWVYQVIERQEHARAKLGKGLKAREWNVSLHLVDATTVELESIEFKVFTASRAWKGRNEEI